MLQTLTRYPTILGASIFIFFGVVYAQATLDEQPVESDVVASSTPEAVIEEEIVATSSDLTIEETATTSDDMASNTGSVDEQTTPPFEEVANEESIATSSESAVEEIVSTTTQDSLEISSGGGGQTETASSSEVVVEASVETEAIVFTSIREISTPGECRIPSALNFFDSISECSRYVLDKRAEEKFEEIERPESQNDSL